MGPPSRSHSEFFFLENHPKIPLNQYHVCSVCIHIVKVVSYYDLSVLSMSVMGFKKKVWRAGGWVGGVSSIQVFF